MAESLQDRDAIPAEDLAFLNDGSDAGAEPSRTVSDDNRPGTPLAPDSRRSETLVDDLASEEGREAPRTQDQARSEDREGRQDGKIEIDPAKWREEFADRLTSRLKDRMTAAQLDNRRKAVMNQLGRYKSAEDYMIAGFAAQEKIRSGDYRAKPMENATPEELDEWRQEHGIPVKAKDYEVPKINGYKWTDADKPLIENFKTFAHKANYTQDQVNAGTEWYVKTVQEAQEKYWDDISKQDNGDKEYAKDQLRAEYGNSDFKPSIILMDRLLNDPTVMPDNLGQRILTSRYTDAEGKSRRLINDPHMARMLINYAKDTYGEGSFITGDRRTTIDSRKAEIERVMNEDYDRYWREGMADEYSKILNEEEEGRGRGRRRG